MAGNVYIGTEKGGIFENLKTSSTPCYIILKKANPREFALAVTKEREYRALQAKLRTSDFKSAKVWLHIEGKAKKLSDKKVEFEYYRTEKSSDLEEDRVLKSYIAKTVFGAPNNASFKVIEDEEPPTGAEYTQNNADADDSALSKENLELQRKLESKLTTLDEKLSEISQDLLKFMNAFYDSLPATVVDAATSELNEMIYGKLEEVFDNKSIHNAINEMLVATTDDAFTNAQGGLAVAVKNSKKAYGDSILTQLDENNPILDGMKVKENGDAIIAFWQKLASKQT